MRTLWHAVQKDRIADNLLRQPYPASHIETDHTHARHTYYQEHITLGRSRRSYTVLSKRSLLARLLACLLACLLATTKDLPADTQTLSLSVTLFLSLLTSACELCAVGESLPYNAGNLRVTATARIQDDRVGKLSLHNQTQPANQPTNNQQQQQQQQTQKQKQKQKQKRQ